MAKVGRPSLYTKELIEQAWDYYLNYEEKGDTYPSLAGLALHLNITRETVNTWRSDEGKEEFSDIASKILAKQEHALTNKGLAGEYNASITKLLLTKHGYSDKNELTGKDGEPLVPEQKMDDMELARRLVFLLDRASRQDQ